MLVRALARGYRSGRTWSPRRHSAVRTVRSARCVLYPALYRRLARERFYLHLGAASTPPADPLPFFSSGLYLMRDLSPEERMRAFVTHREFEGRRRSTTQLARIYRDGHPLWRADLDGVPLDLRLEQSEERDRNEGELSVVLRLSGEVCSRVSFSYVPGWDATTGRWTGETCFLIARNQTQPGPGHERFTAMLPHDSAQMYTLAGTSGVALADGFRTVAAIREDQQVAFEPRLRKGFERSYSGVWEHFPQARVEAGHTEFSACFPATADSPVAASNRPRARQRRRTWDAIRSSARAAMGSTTGSR